MYSVLMCCVVWRAIWMVHSAWTCLQKAGNGRTFPAAVAVEDEWEGTNGVRRGALSQTKHAQQPANLGKARPTRALLPAIGKRHLHASAQRCYMYLLTSPLPKSIRSTEYK